MPLREILHNMENALFKDRQGSRQTGIQTAIVQTASAQMEDGVGMRDGGPGNQENQENQENPMKYQEKPSANQENQEAWRRDGEDGWKFLIPGGLLLDISFGFLGFLDFRASRPSSLLHGGRMEER